MFFPFCSLVFLDLIAVLLFGTGFLKEQVPQPTERAFVAFYCLLMFLSTFANVAFTHEALLAFNGNAVSLTRGLTFAPPAVCCNSFLEP